MPIDPPTNYHVPHIYETTHKGERGYDIWSRLLIDRIIFMGTPIDDQIANVIIAQLLYLESQDPEKDIYMYVNSPGGVITAGMAIYDTMNYIRPDVATICVGQAASMGAVLLAAGAKGKRRALPHSRILIHQPLGSVRGQATDIEIQAKEIMRWKKTLNETLARDTGQTYEQVAEDTERDRIMGPVEAKEYGLVDEVINVAHPDGEA